MEIEKFLAAIDEGRKEKGLTWEELYDRCGVSCLTVNNWRRGKCIPRVSTLMTVLNEVGRKIVIVSDSGGQ